MIGLIVNGEPRQVEPTTTLRELVSSLSSSTTGIAVAINANIVPKSAWSITALVAGDRIEILTAAPGG